MPSNPETATEPLAQEPDSHNTTLAPGKKYAARSDPLDALV